MWLSAASLLAALLLSSASAAAQPPAARADSAAAAVDPYHDHWLARDKAAHFALSCAIIGFGYHLGRYEGSASRPGARNAAVGISLALGVAKEIRDATRKGNHFSLKDLAADIAGTACGALLFTQR